MNKTNPVLIHSIPSKQSAENLAFSTDKKYIFLTSRGYVKFIK